MTMVTLAQTRANSIDARSLCDLAILDSSHRLTFLSRPTIELINDTLDYANPDIFRQIGGHSIAKGINEGNASRTTSQWRNRVIPLAFLPLPVRNIEVRQHTKARINNAIMLFDSPSSFHVGLPKAQVDVEIRVGVSKSPSGRSK